MREFRFGTFTVNEAERRLVRDGATVHLTPRAFDLLLLLLSEAPRVVPKDELHARLWPDTFVADTTLVSVVKELRRAIDPDTEDVSWIRTVHRIGYAFADRGEPADALPPRRIWYWVLIGGRQIVLSPGANLVGRDPAAAVFVDSGGVSRHHARVVIDAEGASIEDLGSKNGTWVDGEQVTKRTPLHDGARVELGSEEMIFRSSAMGVSTQVQPRRQGGT